MTTLTAQQLTIGSYNIRYANPEDATQGNGWEQRLPVISQLIKFNDFDILGAQEVLHPQLNDLLAQLPAGDYTGVGRDDGKTEGEYAPVFYRKDKVTLLRSGHFWLSEQTDHPNKGWDAVLPRICTWAEFKVKETGLTLWFFNLHMDHIGVEARRQSALLVLRKIEEMCGEAPVILTGDFNVDQISESYLVFAHSGTLVDTYETTAVRYAVNGTFNNFEPNRKDDSRIDHIFVSPTFRVERYGILTDMYWGTSV
ncbi:MAG: endonuclease/exonuclease/phosphatase family protein, partial [Tannerellaceae bacterium]|nr:endonuclease/exonuclease/phosphatase family protein [Tannerellaceae bacterium]